MTDTNDSLKLIGMVAKIVAGYVSNHTMPVEDIPAFISFVQHNFCGFGVKNICTLKIRTEPAVPIEESIKPDFIICLEDGRPMKSLKRYLRASYGLRPDQYREKWNLPDNYPMVAPNYAKRRQAIAKSIGLGLHSKGKRRVAA